MKTNEKPIILGVTGARRPDRNILVRGREHFSNFGLKHFILKSLDFVSNLLISSLPSRFIVGGLYKRITWPADERDVFTRYEDEELFESSSFAGKDLLPKSFPGRDTYILSDRQVSLRARAAFGQLLTVEDFYLLSEDEIAKGVFYIYYLCDSMALPILSKIRKGGGIWIPHLGFGKTSYRFVNELALQALQRTWSKRDRVSHLHLLAHENICEALFITRNLIGDYVEVGVYLGGSALTAINFIDLLQMHEPDHPVKKAWLLDTFDGFNYEEARKSQDAIWADTHGLFGIENTKKYISETLKGPNVPFELVEGNICNSALPDDIRKIAVANIDVDMYDPTLAALNSVADLVVPGGIIICEDAAATPSLYGAFLAMEEFLATEKGSSYLKIFKGDQYFLIKTR